MNWLSPNKIAGPDGVEAWTVAFAACFINFVMAGLARMSGILYVAFIDIFHVDRRDAALPFSVRSSMRNLFGPVVGILGQKYGVRPVAMIGAIIGALSAGIGFYAQDMLWITILWGGVCGIGAALATTLNQAVIGQHFKKYRTTAAGMAFSGGCVGSFLFPVLLEYLLDSFGVQGTFLIISGILMHVIPATMLMKKPKWLKKQNSKIQISTISNEIKNICDTQKERKDKKIFQETTHKSDMNKSTFCKNVEKEYFSTNAGLIKKSLKPNFNTQLNANKKINGEFFWDNRHLIINLILKNLQENRLIFKISYRKFITENNEIQQIEQLFKKMISDVSSDKNVDKNISGDNTKYLDNKELSSKNSSENYHMNDDFKLRISELSNINNSNLLSFLLISLRKLSETDVQSAMILFPEIDAERFVKILQELKHLYLLLEKFSESDNGNITKSSNTFYFHIKTACNLYTRPIFLLICLCRTVHMMTAMPLITTLVDFSMDKGLPKEDGKYVISALSAGDLLGRLCLGWISDRGYITLPKFMMIGMLFQGAFLACLSVMQSKATLLTTIAACGLLQGSLFVRHPVLVNRYLENNEQSIAMGCLNFFSGLLSFALPVYIGFFRDVIGSYNGILYINGAAAAFIGLLWGFERNIIHLSRRSKRNLKIPL